MGLRVNSPDPARGHPKRCALLEDGYPPHPLGHHLRLGHSDAADADCSLGHSGSGKAYQRRASGGRRISTAAVARMRSKALQMPKSLTDGTGLIASTAKPAASASADAAIAGPTPVDARLAASLASTPPARSRRKRASQRTPNSVAKATTTPPRRMVMGLERCPDRVSTRKSKPVAAPAATTVGRMARMAGTGRR